MVAVQQGREEFAERVQSPLLVVVTNGTMRAGRTVRRDAAPAGRWLANQESTALFDGW
jgi:hypothetical protein